MNDDTTPTPRTDAEESNAYIYVSGLDAEDVQKAYDFSRQLERELTASKAEVERLREQLAEAHEELCQAGLREYGN